MRCRKCKQYITEKDWELWIVHRWESHGVSIGDLLEMVKEKIPGVEISEAWIKELVKKHKETGKLGIGLFKN